MCCSSHPKYIWGFGGRKIKTFYSTFFQEKMLKKETGLQNLQGLTWNIISYSENDRKMGGKSEKPEKSFKVGSISQGQQADILLFLGLLLLPSSSTLPALTTTQSPHNTNSISVVSCLQGAPYFHNACWPTSWYWCGNPWSSTVWLLTLFYSEMRHPNPIILEVGWQAPFTSLSPESILPVVIFLQCFSSKNLISCWYFHQKGDSFDHVGGEPLFFISSIWWGCEWFLSGFFTKIIFVATGLSLIFNTRLPGLHPGERCNINREQWMFH